LFDALVVTADVMGHELGERAAEDMARELSAYPLAAVGHALRRCKHEVTGRLTLAQIIQRIDDGHLGVEQAWALAQQARDEANTVVWTEEIAEAFGSAAPLLTEGDAVGARMAFKESYAALLLEARGAKQAAKWRVSLGHDPDGRARALGDAVERGRIAPSFAEWMLPTGERFDALRDRLLAMGNETPGLTP
jgi:hypothetical protein